MKLTKSEVETIKELLDAHGALPRDFQARLFPPDDQAPATQDGAEHIAHALAALAADDVDMAAIAKATETHVWKVPRLWTLAQTLPVNFVAVEHLSSQFENARWLSDENETNARAVIEHARRILATDLSYPIILSQTGQIMDGLHRLAKAVIKGEETIAVVQFHRDPEPDYRIQHA